MLRSMMLALALGLPSAAAAEQFPQTAMDVEVRSDTGAVVGRVAAVERNAEGDIVAVEIPGLEPGSAAYASGDLIADENSLMVRVRDDGERREQRGGDTGPRILR